MKNKTIKVESCHDCPFKNYSYDDFSLGDPHSHHCNLLQQDWRDEMDRTGKYSTLEYFIFFYKNGKVKSKNRKTLDNCPLLEQGFDVSLK